MCALCYNIDVTIKFILCNFIIFSHSAHSSFQTRFCTHTHTHTHARTQTRGVNKKRESDARRRRSVGVHRTREFNYHPRFKRSTRLERFRWNRFELRSSSRAIPRESYRIVEREEGGRGGSFSSTDELSSLDEQEEQDNPQAL